MRLHPARIVLTDEHDTVVVRPENPTAGDGISCTQWDLGAPTIREGTTERPGADGVIDNTLFLGSRTVTLDLVIRGDTVSTPYELADRLVNMTHPYRRPILEINRTMDPPENIAGTWRMRLRGNPFSVAYGRRAASMIELQLTFSAPDGVLEGDTRGVSTSLVTEAPDGPDGLIFPTPFPWTMATDNTGEDLTFTVGGALPVSPNLILYGPATDPSITTTAGETFTFAGLTLTTGQYVVINMRDGTAYRNGNIDDSVYQLVDFTTSTFWRWNPGPRTVRLNGTGQLIVQWRERRLTI